MEDLAEGVIAREGRDLGEKTIEGTMSEGLLEVAEAREAVVDTDLEEMMMLRVTSGETTSSISWTLRKDWTSVSTRTG